MRTERRFWRLQLLVVIVLSLTLFATYRTRIIDTVNAVFLRTMPATSGAIEEGYTGLGIMARSETVVKAPQDGVVTFLVEEAQRVRTGQIVAEMYPDILANATELAEFEAELREFDAASHAFATEAQRDIERLEQSVKELEEEIAHALSAEHDDFVTDLYDTLRRVQKQLEQEKEQFAIERTLRETKRSEMLARYSALQQRYATEAIIIESDQAGIVSFAFDGNEHIEPLKTTSDLWHEVEHRSQYQTLEDGTPVAADDVLFRLIDNFASYVFVRFPDFVSLQEGQAVTLRWANHETKARVNSIHRTRNYTGVWFSVEQYNSSFNTLRHLGEVQVVTKSVQGIHLPKSAVGVRNGQYGVYLMADGSPMFRAVNILAEDDHSVIVDRVGQGMSVVINAKKLFERDNRN